MRPYVIRESHEALTRLSVRAFVIVAAVVLVTGSSAASEATPPRIVSALMLDADLDARADGVRLTYSTRVRHARDGDGRYPFTVSGYRIRSIGSARGKVLVIALAEHAQPDSRARPVIRYRRTSSQPVTGVAKTQAAAQLFRSVRAHRHTPPAQPPVPPPPPPTAKDTDGDGYVDERDCGPTDKAIHPGAPDQPDLSFVDSNCDGVDGTVNKAIFVSPSGKDADPGTIEKPKRQLQAAVVEASRQGKSVYVAAGAYEAFEGETGVGLYGGYDPVSWSRRGREQKTVIAGSPQGILVDNERGIVLQLLTVRGTNKGRSAYGIRAINGSALTLQHVDVSAAAGAPGTAGAAGARGIDGAAGGNGKTGHCDSNQTVSSRWGGTGGPPGASSIGRAGGAGGDGGNVEGYGASGGTKGGIGQIVGADGGTGGAGGGSGDPGRAGKAGGAGASGAAGLRGDGGRNTMALAGVEWAGEAGSAGRAGIQGGGGGGGGGGGAQTGFFVRDGPGNGGGGGGAGGDDGKPGSGGGAGGGSIAIYLHNSTIVIQSSNVTAANGGPGGPGGNGGVGSNGGAGGLGATTCTSEVGAGGSGGRGGDGGSGGAGGGGAGGPSIGVMKVGTSTATLNDTRVTIGAGGAGGALGSIGAGVPRDSQPGIAQAIYP